MSIKVFSVPTLSADLPGPRIHYFDWLRVIAVLGVILYHTFEPFARSYWLIPSPETSETLLAVVSLFDIFGLAILFLIAGASTRFALLRRSALSFLAERAMRLLVPYIVGSIILVPATSYIIQRQLGMDSVPFFMFLAAFPGKVWQYSILPVGLSPEILLIIGLHLWFLGWLFIWSVLGLPVFAFLSSATGKSWVAALGRLARWRGAALLLAIPVTLPRIALSAQSTPRWGWGIDAYFWYAAVFMVGYLIYSDDHIVASIRHDLWLALTVAVLGSAGLFAAGFSRWTPTPEVYDSAYFLHWSLIGFTGWAWILAILGAGMRAKFMQRPLPLRLAQIGMPIYILHYPIIVAVASLVIPWPLALGAKILINSLLGFGLSILAAVAALKLPILYPLLGLRRPGPTILQPRSDTQSLEAGAKNTA